MKMKNDVLCVEIAELGAEITRIYDKENDTEVLWNGDARFWKRHSPILFPNVGKTWKNTLRIDGVRYPTTQHGFARDTQFKCVKTSENTVSFLMHSTEDTKEVYPYDFELYVHYRLIEKSVEVEWQVKNCTAENMYFTIGAHPAFAFQKDGEEKQDYCLKFPGKEKLECIRVDLASGCGLPDATYELKLTDGYQPLSEELFKVDTIVMDDSQVQEAWLCQKDGTPYVGVRCEGFSNFGIWSPAGAPFVCLEPWAGRCDNYGFEEELSKKSDINCLGKEETFSKKYQIVVA